mmetsp:Transcript_16345/g.45559  ORF Transcript_16345/g.45559 Transcript_16345/m.45559 type:complete len:239 (-) Transcript_16345:252-968(-)
MPTINTAPVLPWGQKADEATHGASAAAAAATRRGQAEERQTPAEETEGRACKRPRSEAQEDADPGEAPAAPDLSHGAALPDVGLAVGDRIEVKWDLIDEEDNAVSQWWGAKVIGPASNEEDGRVYTIMYDAVGEFEKTDAKVLFLGGTELYDFGCDSHESGYLRWRLEGSLSDESEDEEAEEICGRPDTITMAELREEVAADADEALEEEAMQELSALPRDRQQHIAAGFRNMIDRVK